LTKWQVDVTTSNPYHKTEQSFSFV